MGATVLEVTKEELRSMVDAMVEEKLATIFDDPEDNLELTDELKAILIRQDKRIKSGDRGETLDHVVSELGLE